MQPQQTSSLCLFCKTGTYTIKQQGKKENRENGIVNNGKFLLCCDLLKREGRDPLSVKEEGSPLVYFIYLTLSHCIWWSSTIHFPWQYPGQPPSAGAAPLLSPAQRGLLSQPEMSASTADLSGQTRWIVWPGKQSERLQTESPLCYGSRWQLKIAVPLLRHPSPVSVLDLPCPNQWTGCCQQPARAIEKRKGLPSACCSCRKAQILVLSPSKTHTDAHTSWARLRHVSAMPSFSKRFSKHHVQNPAPFPGIVNSPSLQSNVLPLIPLTKCQYNQTQKSIQKITYIQIFLQLQELYLWQHALHLTHAIYIQAVFWSCILYHEKLLILSCVASTFPWQKN